MFGAFSSWRRGQRKRLGLFQRAESGGGSEISDGLKKKKTSGVQNGRDHREYGITMNVDDEGYFLGIWIYS